MFFLRRPTAQRIERFRRAVAEDSFSYSQVGSSLQGPLPSGFNVDHNRIHLGEGTALYERACAALRNWKMFELGWVELLHPSQPITPGLTVLILARTWDLYSLSASRVVAMVDASDGSVRRWGFAYGTLQHHVERGEERFTIEHHADDDSVWYDILAFSRPRHPLARLGYPVARAAQRRFAADSKAAMFRTLS